MEKKIIYILLRWLFAGIQLGALMLMTEITGDENWAEARDWAATEQEALPGDVTAGDEAAVTDDILDKLWASTPSCYIGSTGKGIGVSRFEGTEEDLRSLIYSEMDAWSKVGADHIQGQIDLSWEEITLASFEFGDARMVFIALPEGIYRISSVSFEDRDEWAEVMQGMLEEVFSELNLSRERTEDFFRENIAEEEGTHSLMVLRYRGVKYLFDQCQGQRLMSWERVKEGISFREVYRVYEWSEKSPFAERTYEFRRLEELWEKESSHVMRERLQELYPDMDTCYIWSSEAEETSFAVAWRSENEDVGLYCAPTAWQGEVYQIFCRDMTGKAGGTGIQWLIQNNTESAKYYWTRKEYAVLRESDEAQRYYVYRRDTGEERPFIFLVRSVEKTAEEEITNRYELSVYEEGEEQPFQKLECGEEVLSDISLSFTDLNADGYRDLLFGYDPVGKCYLWSPSRKQYVDMTEALGGNFNSYRSDEGKRQLWVRRQEDSHWVENLYQWSGEMDCELLKELNREYICDQTNGAKWREITITVREDGEEKVLTDYIYSEEEYWSREDEIGEIMDLDFVWEQEVKVEGEDHPCILRYAQERTREDDETVRYTDRLFLFRWDTYLIDSCRGMGSPFRWEKITLDKAGRLHVTYENGSSVVYSREFFHQEFYH